LAAVNNLKVSLSKELGQDGITVNAVSPPKPPQIPNVTLCCEGATFDRRPSEILPLEPWFV
jgi:NAD(P)-dependent dehydrogenase (short-subunit alcohol dehydrogenase family)